MPIDNAFISYDVVFIILYPLAAFHLQFLTSRNYITIFILLFTALQLLEFPYGNGMEVVFGGGRRELMHKNQTDPEYPDKKGDRLDGRDLISEWVNKFQNSKYVWNKTEFEQIDVDKVDHVIGMKFFIYT